jgi:hypothetical protein
VAAASWLAPGDADPADGDAPAAVDGEAVGDGLTAAGSQARTSAERVRTRMTERVARGRDIAGLSHGIPISPDGAMVLPKVVHARSRA